MTTKHACSGGAEVAVSWDEGLVLHEGDDEWHLWDTEVYGPLPGDARTDND